MRSHSCQKFRPIAPRNPNQARAGSTKSLCEPESDNANASGGGWVRSIGDLQCQDSRIFRTNVQVRGVVELIVV